MNFIKSEALVYADNDLKLDFIEREKQFKIIDYSN